MTSLITWLFDSPKMSLSMEHLQKVISGESNSHVIDDVTWPRKVKLVTSIHLNINILKFVGGRVSVPMEYLQEIIYAESNGHVTDDVTWSWEVKVAIWLHYRLNISKQFKITGRCQWKTSRKSYRGSWMVTWSMTPHDLERWRSWPRYIWTLISRNLLEVECRFLWSLLKHL